MKSSYRPFIALGALFMLLGLGAGVYLIAKGGSTTPSEVPTEVQVLGSTTTLAKSTTTLAKGATTTTVAKGATTTTKATTTTAKATKDASGLTIVKATQLPKEAQTTLALIAKGGPYPYDRDGIVFQNREGLLPKKSTGYYHEYTVVTPGESDRGARRVIAGSNGELYYTADHYASFVRVEVAS